MCPCCPGTIFGYGLLVYVALNAKHLIHFLSYLKERKKISLLFAAGLTTLTGLAVFWAY